MTKELIYENKKIRYRVFGSGKPVLLVHGFGEDGRIWDGVTDTLKDRFLLIVPDLPGSGASEMTGDMSIEGLAEVMHAITSREIPEKVRGTGAIIGHSMGGYIALAFAEKFPGTFPGLGLFHSSAYADSEEKKETRRKGIRFIREHGAFEFLKTVIPNLFSPVTREKNMALVLDFIDQQHNFSPEALVSYYEAMIRRPDRTSVLQNHPGPVLFIMGKYDMAVPITDALEQSHLPEKSYIHILQNSAHLGMLEEFESCIRFLDEFLLVI